MRLNYVGRRTISRYGCYGCHDIPNFETARPIGTTLQDWGRKDTSRLAPEHIDEYLEEHKEANGIDDARAGRRSDEGGPRPAERRPASSRETSKKPRCGRPTSTTTSSITVGPASSGRSSAIRAATTISKTETKGYDERLRMPKFPFNEEDIEAISTFVLGLVADPPAKEYIYQSARARPRRGSRASGCSTATTASAATCSSMPEIHYAVDPREITASTLQAVRLSGGPSICCSSSSRREKAKRASKQKVKTDRRRRKTLPVMRFHGLIMNRPDPDRPRRRITNTPTTCGRRSTSTARPFSRRAACS